MQYVYESRHCIDGQEKRKFVHRDNKCSYSSGDFYNNNNNIEGLFPAVLREGGGQTAND